jgi:hypothetical protein
VEFWGRLAAIVTLIVAGVALIYVAAPRCTDASQHLEIGSVLLAGCARAAQ